MSGHGRHHHCADWNTGHILTGLDLRRTGLSYTAIAIVLDRYHNLPGVTSGGVRHMLRKHGATAKPRGNMTGLHQYTEKAA